MTRARLPALLLFAAFAFATALPAFAQEWLTNGGFESGSGGWVFTEAIQADCQPHEGTGVLGLSPIGPASAKAFRNVFGPLPAGDYTLTGWTRVQGGSGEVRITLSFLHDFGSRSGITAPVAIPSGAQYTPFSITTRAQNLAESAEVAFYLTNAGSATLCIDSLSLTSPDSTPTATPAPTHTPTPTHTLPPTPTDTPVPPTATLAPATATSPPAQTISSPTPTSTSTSTSTPTLTPVTTASATATPRATGTPTATPTSGPSFTFINGGFEQGLAGWSKYGGTLSTTTGANTGTTAGLLTSTTESTKWAYQAVRIDPAQHYEFSAHVQADGGVKEAYLRISWYPTSDASGPALSTTDSTQHTGPGSYVRLTTGAVKPPAGAVSARVRVLLAPLSAANASIAIDDVAFHTTAAPTPTATHSPSPSATVTGARGSSTPTVSPTVAPLGVVAGPSDDDDDVDWGDEASESDSASFISLAVAAPATMTSSTQPAGAIATAEPIAEVAASRSYALASAESSSTGTARSIARPTSESGAMWPWVVGAVLLFGGLGGAYIQNRREGG